MLLKHSWLLFWVFTTSVALAQTPPNHPKKTYTDSLNRYYQHVSLPVYVFVATSPTGPPVPLGREQGERTEMERRAIYLDGHGKHYLRHLDAVDPHTDYFAIYADGLPPTTEAKFSNAARHQANGRQYFGPGLTLTLTARDQMSGLEQIYYSLNGRDFAPYTGPIQLDQAGQVVCKYYAVDRVGNMENIHDQQITVDIAPPRTYHNVVGIAQNNVISLTTKLYLTSVDSVAGVARTFYKLDDRPFVPVVPGSNLPLAQWEEGSHTLTYYSVDETGNREPEQTFSFYLDKTAPIMSADILGDRFIVDDRVYFSGRTKLKLTAVDNRAGIKQTLYSLDGEPYHDYTEPFYLPAKSGLHTIRYYAIDNMGNQGAGNPDRKYDEVDHTVGLVYVDLTGPSLNHQFLGKYFTKGDTVFINRQTRIQLGASDAEAGLQYIAYQVDGETEERRYTTPFVFNDEGAHQITIVGYDNVNNRNLRSFLFVLDNQGPLVSHTFSVSPIGTDGGLPVYPSYASLFLAATDTQTGFEGLRYSLNGSKEAAYPGQIKGFGKNKTYTVRVRAEDKLGNSTTTEIKFKTGKY
ncbi:MAG: hypothetical protein MUC97_00275 [Bernardetiaceae bacterium]|jgi:hypothetical protein|nr:hypothetical protein [Bernardetiaceae bacterium]